MKIAFRNSDTAVKKETWHYLKKKTPIEMFDQISLIINPCLLNPTKMKYINLNFLLNPEIQWFPIFIYDSKFIFTRYIKKKIVFLRCYKNHIIEMGSLFFFPPH